MKSHSFAWLLLLACVYVPPLLAFPENVRQGYASCQSCHVNPTGGGLLTEYGRRTSEEFLSTWQSEKEANLFYGLGPTLPESLLLGGDFRSVALQKDNNTTITKAFIPMQADLQLAWQISESWSLALTAGAYDSTVDTRQHYLMYKPTENFYGRAGRFMRAYGINTADHSLLVRKLLGFNQGQETNNLELGIITEKAEYTLSVTKGKQPGSLNGQEDGTAARAVFFLGERSYAGVSLLRAQGPVWNRDVMGAFFVVGLSKTLYVQGEYDQTAKKAADSSDLSTPDHKSSVSFFRIAWEALRGFHAFVTTESSDPIGDPRYSNKQRIYGPGVQWFPRPHLEFVAKAEKRLDETFSKDYGSQYLLMSHFYL